jgi:hypothetical protein
MEMLLIFVKQKNVWLFDHNVRIEITTISVSTKEPAEPAIWSGHPSVALMELSESLVDVPTNPLHLFLWEDAEQPVDSGGVSYFQTGPQGLFNYCLVV